MNNYDFDELEDRINAAQNKVAGHIRTIYILTIVALIAMFFLLVYVTVSV